MAFATTESSPREGGGHIGRLGNWEQTDPLSPKTVSQPPSHSNRTVLHCRNHEIVCLLEKRNTCYIRKHSLSMKMKKARKKKYCIDEIVTYFSCLEENG